MPNKRQIRTLPADHPAAGGSGKGQIQFDDSIDRSIA
jgi:hypothetical protein